MKTSKCFHGVWSPLKFWLYVRGAQFQISPSCMLRIYSWRKLRFLFPVSKSKVQGCYSITSCTFHFHFHFCFIFVIFVFSFLSWKLGYTLIFIWNPAFHKLWVGFQVIVFLPCQWNYSFHYFPICPLVMNLNSYPIIVSSMSDFWHFPPFFSPSLSYILWAMSTDYLLGYVRARNNWASISFGFRQA